MPTYLRISSNCGLVLAACLVISGTATAGKGGRDGGKESLQPAAPISLEHESYFFRDGEAGDCLGEDDELQWNASGTLAPGESFSFTPAYPGCLYHSAAITVIASWEAGTLELSSQVPDTDYTSWDNGQLGQPVSAPAVGNQAQLCMFPTYKSGGALYTVTLTNRGDQAVHGIVLEGRHENDWSIYYYPRCINADADADGWNDSLEHTMAALLYPVGYIDGEYQPFKLWGSNYLRAEASSPASNDEIDSLPPDLNDDGLVDPADLVLFDDWLGEGNGIALQSISPNSGPDGYYPNSRPWRRFDLDADGHVGPEDRDILLQAIAQGPFGGVDEIDPTARVLLPIESASVPRGQPYRIEAHAWDNASLARVDYVVDGKVVCSVTDPVPDWGFDSPMYSCWWSVPRRSRAYQIQVIAVDAAGNRGYSPLRMITAH